MNTGNSDGIAGCTFTDLLDGEDRAGTHRHFSDQSYALLAHNIGLNIMTVYNWDFTNPNAEDAHAIEIVLLTTSPTLTLSTWWNGSRSPWRDPTITSTCMNCRTFQGSTYNEFKLNFSVAKSWTNGPDGVVPGGEEFHIGAGFSESALAIVYDTKLKDSGGSDLTLHPRMAGFDHGVLDLASGDFEMNMFNTDAAAGDLIVRNMQIQFLPRLVDINSMVQGEPLRDVRGTPVKPQAICDPKRCKPRKDFDLKNSKGFFLGKVSDDRFVDIRHHDTDCEPGVVYSGASPGGDMEGGSMRYCLDKGYSLSMFPSTSVYVTATIVDPNARHFDKNSGTYVNGPLESKVFYQFVGMVPDLNKNGIDDLIDIREGTSRDDDGNGVVDEVEKARPSDKKETTNKLPWWVYLTWVISVIILIALFYRKKTVG